jgi:hypothetical protein
MPSGAAFTWTATNTLGTVIGYNGCSSGCGTTISDVLSNLGTVHGTVVYTITPTSDLGCSGGTYTATVTVGVTPAVPGAISGPAVVCGLTTATYSIAPVTDATTYTWTVPTGITGMTILSGQGTTSINVSISAAIPSSTITVTAGNGCGTSATQSLSITRKPLVSGAISGPTSACGITSATYSITPVFGATSYTWTLPAGVTVGGSSGTVTGLGSTITVNIASTFAYGVIAVASVNSCGSTAGTSIGVMGKPPGIPGVLSGPVNVCGMSTVPGSVTYSIPAVAYASGYTWTVPSWIHIDGGAGTTAITVHAQSSPVNSTVISVAATNVCGTGATRSVTLTTAAIQPGAMTGPASLCGQSTATYSVPSLGAGYTYNWTLSMSGWTITSGLTTNTITIAGSSTGASHAGLVLVSSTNTCSATPSGQRTYATTYCHDAIGMNSSNDNGSFFSSVYPNPTATDFKIDVTTDIDREITVQVYDVQGNLVISQKHQIAAGTSTMNTNIESYKNGMYFVRLVDSNATTVYSQTVIKN